MFHGVILAMKIYRFPKKKVLGIVPIWAQEKPEIKNYDNYTKAMAKLYGGTPDKSEMEIKGESESGVLDGDLFEKSGDESANNGSEV
jgi:hypothetical protein